VRKGQVDAAAGHVLQLSDIFGQQKINKI
jgi:hypothetical protein